jgi:hypothetical protein
MIWRAVSFGCRSASEALFIGNHHERHKGRVVDFGRWPPYCRCRKPMILFAIVAYFAGSSGL